MLQLPVLVLQLLQLLGFTAVHPTVLRLPAVVSLLRDPVLPGQLRRCQSCLALLQDRDDLLFARNVRAWQTVSLSVSAMGWIREMGSAATGSMRIIAISHQLTG